MAKKALPRGDANGHPNGTTRRAAPVFHYSVILQGARFRVEQDVEYASDSDIKLACLLLVRAMRNAVEIVRISRRHPRLREFVDAQARLASALEYFNDHKRQLSPSLESWVQNPGATFAHRAGYSLPDVGWRFASDVYEATMRGRMLLFTGCDMASLVISPVVDERLRTWCERTLVEVTSDPFPPSDSWPLWHVNRDFEAWMVRLESEYAKSTGDKGVTGERCRVAVANQTITVDGVACKSVSEDMARFINELILAGKGDWRSAAGNDIRSRDIAKLDSRLLDLIESEPPKGTRLRNEAWLN